MTSVVDICNAAISHCGTRSKISSIDEASREALACKTHYEQVRDGALRSYDWNFARMTVSLAALTCSVQRWQYEYAVPVDCLRLRRLNDQPMLLIPPTWYEMAADKDADGNPINVIFTNQSPVSAIYTALIADPSRWDSGFQDVVAYGLASRIAFELTGKEEVVARVTKLWAGTLSQAATDMLNENPSPAPTYVPEALSARGYDDGLAEQGLTWPRSWG
jgi:hypothetical protein